MRSAGENLAKVGSRGVKRTAAIALVMALIAALGCGTEPEPPAPATSVVAAVSSPASEPSQTPAPSPSPTAASSDRESLIALYNAAYGWRWINNDNWLSDLPLSEWHGVSVDDDGRVTSLFLSNNGLVGKMIPP